MKLPFLFKSIALVVGFSTAGLLTAASNNPSATDTGFSTKAAAGGMAEVKLGHLALQKASSPDVKVFAQRMIDDHSKANDKLKSIAGRDNITLPSDVDAKDQATYDHLSKLQGSQFDRAYMRDMVKDHQADVALFQKEADTGRNTDLKSFASETLPTLQDHLKMADNTMGKLK